MKILFISSVNLTLNPRIKKELLLSINCGFETHFIGFETGGWSSEIEKNEIKNLNADFTYLSATRKPFLIWFFSSLIEKISKIFFPILKNNLNINAFAHSKRSILLTRFLKKNKIKFDLIIAHTLPTLYSAYKLSIKQNIPFSFDIEDFHPGEIITSDTKNEIKRRIFLMKNILPKATYLTYASPLIGKYSIDLLDNKIPNHFLVNNCFSEKEFQFNENKSEKIKFVWFSQNISSGRGLELIVPALYKFKEQIEITLIGNLYQNFYEKFLVEYSDLIKFEKPLHQKDLNLKLSEFEIGLAIELKSADFNRDICLTNKIFAYAQSGLFILATDTQAQKLFIRENINLGIICEQTEISVENQIKNIINDIENIRKNKYFRYEYSKKLAWENESVKLVIKWNEILTTKEI